MGIASGHTFYDIHCHAFNLSHPSLYGFLENLRHSNAGDLLKEVFTLSEFMPIRNLATTRRHLRNLLAVMEHDVGGMFLLMEDDLSGKFRSARDTAFLHDDVLSIGGNSYDRIILTPLLIDFNTPALSADDIYYNRPPKKLLQKQIDDTLNGIRFYLKERPKGLLEIYPFIGLNPANYSLAQVQKIMNDYFGLHAISRHLFYKAFQAMNHLDVGAPISGSRIIRWPQSLSAARF